MKRDPVTGHFLPSNKRSAAMRTAASSIGRILRGNPGTTLSASELGALRRYAARHGRTWKAALRADWSRGTLYLRGLSAADESALAYLRNRLGPRWLARFVLPRPNPSKRKASPKRRTVKRATRKPSRVKRRSAR